MAAKSKFTTATKRRIIRALTAGATRKMACQVAGVSQASFYNWLRDNPDFLERVERAEAECGLALLEQLQEAIAQGDAASARWLLEKKFPEEFGKRVDLRMHYSTEQAEGLVEIIRRVILDLPYDRQQDVLAWMEALENGLPLPDESDLLALPEEVEAA